MKNILETIVKDNFTHARWLNTLSYLEHCGLHKISAYQNRIYTDINVLKHAAEGARYAYYFKRQILKLCDISFYSSYGPKYIFAPAATYRYLFWLDTHICKSLKEMGFKEQALFNAAYVLVTYAIEVRADELYVIYQEILSKIGSKVNVKSIIAEETVHLEEMNQMLASFGEKAQTLSQMALQQEAKLYDKWIKALAKETQ